jgi:hypothetical protein
LKKKKKDRHFDVGGAEDADQCAKKRKKKHRGYVRPL